MLLSGQSAHKGTLLITINQIHFLPDLFLFCEIQMPAITFKCAISSTMVSYINLQSKPVALHQSGTNWTGSLTLNVADTLEIAYTVTGITDSPWTVDVTVDCPGGTPAKIFSASGNIPHGGSVGDTKTVKVPANPCAPKDKS
jgi:hypothetical protein